MKNHFLLFLIFFCVFAETSYSEKQISGQADHIPWSGYWWPTKFGELVRGYQGKPSPFQKYDLYTNSVISGPLMRWGLDSDNFIYNSTAPGWWGQCHAWASASILEPYDFIPSITRGIIFNTGDKKGLITTLHQKDLNNAVICDDPLSFHTFLLQYVGDEKIGMCSDLDPGEEVWTYPLYKYEGSISESETYDDIQMKIYYANDLDIDPDYIGTVVKSKNYTYRLFKDEFGYTEGDWTGGSISDHPHTAWFPTTQKTYAPLDASLVRGLAEDSFQGPITGDTLITGHNIIIVNYGQKKELLAQIPEDTQKIRLKFLADSQRNTNSLFNIQIFADNFLFFEKDLNDEIEIETQDISGCTLKVAISHKVSGYTDTDPIACHLYFDLDLPYTIHLPGQQQSLWQGLAIANKLDSNSTNIVFPTFYSTSGNPRMGFGPLTLPQDGHWSSLVDGLSSLDINELDQIANLKITSQNPVNVLRLFGNENSLSGPFSSRVYPSDQKVWVIPILTSTLETTIAKLFITNTSPDPVQSQIQYFSKSGILAKSQSITFDGLETGSFSSGSYPGINSITGWGLISDPNGILAGTIQYRESSVLYDEIPFLAIGNNWKILHPAALSGWETTLTLFNTSDSTTDINLDLLTPVIFAGRNHITLAEHEKKSIVLDSNFFSLDNPTIDESTIEITSNNPIAGYITYRHSQGGLIASLPLSNFNDESSMKILGHVASNDIWWTGIVLYNTSSQSTQITFQAYNDLGLMISENAKTIPGNTKLATMVREIFPHDHDKIVTMKIFATSPISGYALFGDLSAPGFSYLSAFML